MTRIITMGIMVSFFLMSELSASVIRVPGDQPTIQAGIDAAADGDIVLVADGTYTGSGNRQINYNGKAITVRSENGPDYCAIELEGNGPAFLFQNGEGRASVLRGFHIKNGNTSLSGCGVRCLGTAPTIVANRFRNLNTAASGGAIICDMAASPSIRRNGFYENSAGIEGGAIACAGSSYPSIYFNYIFYNEAPSGGAISVTDGASVSLSRNRVFRNNATTMCGGVYCGGSGSSVSIWDCVITENTAAQNFGGVGILQGSEGMVFMSLIADNVTNGTAGGIHVGGPGESTLDMRLTTVRGNQALYGGGVGSGVGIASINSCIIWGNTAPNDPQCWVSGGTFDLVYSCVQGGWTGTGNISGDPLFTSGPWGDDYLSQQASGQPQDSPCVDAGSPAFSLYPSTTRTDGGWDRVRVDMGYHRAPGRVVAGPGPAYDNPPSVRLLPADDGASPALEFTAYGPPHYGVNVCCARVYSSAETEDTDQILTGPGPGTIYGPHIRGFFVDGTPIPGLSFLAYGTKKFGANVTAGHTQSGIGDAIITGAGPGAVFGPHVRAFYYDKNSESVSPLAGVSFFAYGTKKWGVNVTAGDIDDDGMEEIITGPGPGAVFGPHIRAWNVDGGPVTAIPGVSFFAYGTKKYGVNVACGNADGDGIAEIVTAPGPGSIFGTHVRGWNYDGLTITPLEHFSFFAWPTGQARYGAKVFARSDMDQNGWNEIIVGAGPDPGVGSPIKGYQFITGEGMQPLFTLDAFPSGYSHGVCVTAGRL